ncbi:MAG: hypothetical protein EOO44_14975 [Flavobacterium sp.]|nr:MAG: hypothetical protein EOO44_14975 [Flavobacterium sp.]
MADIHFPKEPVYQVYVKNSLCVYELLVNDYPVGKMFDYAQQATPYDINSAILKSGKQKITLRIYPAPAEYSRSGDELSPNTSCKLKIEYVDNKDLDYKIVPVAEFKLPTKTRMAGQNNDVAIPYFKGEGKKFYEITYEFDAIVPYENEGWSKGQDLTKLDQKLLEKKAVEFYDYYKDIYSTDKADELAKNEFNSMKRDAISQYQDKEKISKIWSEYLHNLKLEKKWYSLDKNKKVLYGNGKIVKLEQSNSDPSYRGESALYFDSVEEGATYGNSIGLYLYLPKGKKLEDGLEVIR